MVDRIWRHPRDTANSHGFLSTTFDEMVDSVIDSLTRMCSIITVIMTHARLGCHPRAEIENFREIQKSRLQPHENKGNLRYSQNNEEFASLKKRQRKRFVDARVWGANFLPIPSFFVPLIN